MKMDSNAILITGGATGIGLALAERFIHAGNKVIICGRRADKLEEAKAKNPQLHIYQSDISKEADRIELYNQITQDHPDVNILFNNAGIMRYLDLAAVESWKDSEVEIATNLEAPIHLALLFTQHFARKENTAILNVTSGLAHVPLAATPLYCATKAAIHSFTLSLRKQLAKHDIQVIEICPPLTNTDLGVPGTNTAGIPVDEFADEVIKGLAQGVQEIAYGWSKLTSQASRSERDEIFEKLNVG
ncbi:SDR family oxidoreductase [Paenibacillus macerans]|uniref:SDR family oxidoreductase n=1 Tax=Paenibacillus macerans TaxID=44252 RepID=UPI003D31873A